MSKRYWLAALPALLAGVACSGEGFDQEFDFEAQEQELRLMPKPGSQNVLGEAGVDVAQVGSYTFYGANTEPGPSGGTLGAAHLFKNNAPFRSYQARSHNGSQMGRFIGLSEDWAATGLTSFPVSPGQFPHVLMLIGKSGGDFASCGSIASDGTLPNCVTCSGSQTNGTLSCTPAASGVHIVRPPTGYSFSNTPVFEFDGKDLFVGDIIGSNNIYHLRYNGSQWVNHAVIPAPAPGVPFGQAIAISGNLMAVSGGPSTNPDRVYVYSRSTSTSPWVVRLRIDQPSGHGITRFGERLDLDGTTLLIGAAPHNAHFVELVPQNFSTPSSALNQSCALFTGGDTQVSDVAISGNRAVMTTYDGPYLFSRNTNWTFHGGFPDGLFPHDNGFWDGNIKSAAIHGDSAAVGWTKYAGSSSGSPGAVLGFNFDQYGCGNQMGLPGSGLVRAQPASFASASATYYNGYPPSNAVDNNSLTRWMAPATNGTRLELDLGEHRVLSHLEIDWGARYAHDYLIEVSDDPETVPANQRVWRWATHITGGDGNTDILNFRQVTENFARRIRITMNGFGTLPGQSDLGVSVKGVRAYSMVHPACTTPKPTLNCTTAKATASAP